MDCAAAAAAAAERAEKSRPKAQQQDSALLSFTLSRLVAVDVGEEPPVQELLVVVARDADLARGLDGVVRKLPAERVKERAAKGRGEVERRMKSESACRHQRCVRARERMMALRAAALALEELE